MDKYYDTISRGYEELYEEEQIKKARIVNKLIINNFKLIKKLRILDVGCGTGISEIVSRKIVGIDPSIKLLKKAKIKKILGVAESLPFKDGVFDIVLSITAIHNFKNIRKSIKEIIRVSKKKNPCIIISVLKKSSKFRLIEGLLTESFRINKRLEEEKDVIFFLTFYG